MATHTTAPTRLATSIGLLLCLAVAGFLPSARAAEAPGVLVGDVVVSSEAGAASEAMPELGRALRLSLKEELSHLSGLGPVRRSVVVSATLTRLSSESRAERAKASATISLALRRADDQVVFAELRGRASVEESSGNLASLRRAALQGAVRGALARLPEAVRAAR